MTKKYGELIIGEPPEDAIEYRGHFYKLFDTPEEAQHYMVFEVEEVRGKIRIITVDLAATFTNIFRIGASKDNSLDELFNE